MAPKKKSLLGYSGALLLLLFMLLLGNSCIAYEYTEQYDLTETDIKNIYEHQRDLSVNNAISSGTNYNKIINNWSSCNTAIENVSNWETLCLTLNVTMRNYFINSGEFFGYNSTEMNDSNLWCIVSPASSVQSSTNQLRIHFIPNVSVYPQATEYNGQAGLYKTISTKFYEYNSAGTAVSTSYLSYSTAPVVTLMINNDGTWQVGYRNSNLFSGVQDAGDFYQYATSPSTEGNWLYNMNLLSLYRNNFLTTPNKQAYLPYGSSIYLTKWNENRYSLTTQTFGSGEYIPPSPTPQPTPSGDGSVDLTETNSLISNVIDELTYTPSGDDFNFISSGDIIESLDFNNTEDPYENFWQTILNSLYSALTNSNITTYEIDFLGETFILNSNDWLIDYPEPISYLLTISTTIGIVLANLKVWRKLTILINSGDIFTVSSKISKADISDVF